MIADFLFSLILFLCFMFLIVCLVNSSARGLQNIPTHKFHSSIFLSEKIIMLYLITWSVLEIIFV